jgi:hypothetical protein
MSDTTELANRFGDGGQTVLNRSAPAARPASQATQVEQSRAVAEVRAAVLIAMERPRDRIQALSEMREVCAIPALADRAFFSVPRGSETVNGASIHLARELARCWGNIDYGVKELARDDVAGQSELLAFAWDLQTNARSEIVFVVPHTRGRNRTRLTDTQSIYENNASFAGRRLREAIFAVLPVWLKSEAEEICQRTIEGVGAEKPLMQRIADTRSAFEALGVSSDMLERKQAKPLVNFLPSDLATLRVIYQSLKRNEITMDEAFPRPEPSEQGVKESKLSNIEAKLEARGVPPAESAPPVDDPAPGKTPPPAEAEQAEQSTSGELQAMLREINETATLSALDALLRNAAFKARGKRLAEDEQRLVERMVQKRQDVLKAAAA